MQHTINYLDMDFQDYESLTGPSTGDYEDGCLDDIEVHRTFQKPSRSQQPFRTFQPPRNQQQRQYLPSELWNALPTEAQEVLRQYGSKDNPPSSSRGPPKLMAKFHDYQLTDDFGIDLDDQDPQTADLAHGDSPYDKVVGSAAPDPALNEDAQPLLAFLSNHPMTLEEAFPHRHFQACTHQQGTTCC